MNEGAEIPVLSATFTAMLLVVGATFTLIGSLGLLRLRTFYQRVHAPTLGTTLGTTCIAIASMIYFSTLGTRPVLHEVLIVIFITTTMPIALMILVRGAVLRDELGDYPPLPGAGESERRTR
ncbi:MAG TPA: monovalent cation/H(+) antiporter subunit G [Pseudolabrys sp.]|nr:monovalent cation/H(+) antiporter subunit G [Pseudolabrys sp.]